MVPFDAFKPDGRPGLLDSCFYTVLCIFGLCQCFYVAHDHNKWYGVVIQNTT